MCHFRPTYNILYIVMCDINMTTVDNGGVNSVWLGGVEFFRGGITPLYGVASTPPYGVAR